MNNRRRLLVAFGAGAFTAPLRTFAQQPAKVYRIGFLGAASAAASARQVERFRVGLRELGYVEGKNLVIDWSFADGKYERLPGFAAEFVKMKVDVIVAAPSPAIRAAQQATTTIPIVMAGTGDPIGAGFVASLARPAGNITGLSNVGGEISVKHLELLMAMVPTLSRVAVLGNPGSTTHSTIVKNVVASAQKGNVRVVSLKARTPEEIERGFSSMRRERVDAVIVAVDGFLTSQRAQIAELAAKYRLPSIFGTSSYPQVGGLMSYSQKDQQENYQRAAIYVDKILKGAKPADLPVEQPMRFELIINRKTAKALGLTIPQSLLMSAKMIE
jgi:putative ABC transport system substrate-binding protein